MDRVPYFSYFTKRPILSRNTNMATFVILRFPVTNLVKGFANPNNLTNDLLILNSLIVNKSLVKQMMQLKRL